MDDRGRMSTLIAVVILIVIGFSGQWLWLTALNIAGMPGALLGLQFRRDRAVGSVQGILGIAVAVLGQSYVYLAFVALVVNLTKHYIHQNGVSPVFVWPAAFFACVFPIYLCAAAAEGEYSQGSGSAVQTVAVIISQFLAAIGFFVFVFFPNVIALGWPWTRWLS